MPRPVLLLLLVLIAFSLQGYFECRETAACGVAVMHNKGMQ